jgi:undecaprenyl-diphosphatase
MQNLFGTHGSVVLFDVMVHVGTLAAIILVFRKDIADVARTALGTLTGRISGNHEEQGVLAGIVVGSIPTAVIGLMFSEQFKRLFTSMTAAGIGLLLTGVVLMSTVVKGGSRHGTEAHESRRLRLVHALLIGIAQGCAIAPGISRSGVTIAVALLLGVERGLAARFSFLLAIPAIVGALGLELRNHFLAAGDVPAHVDTAVMFSGALVAAITGIFALNILMGIVRHGKISLFAYYCWVLGVVAIALGIVRS